MDAVILGRLKDHCHVDHDEDDGKLAFYYDAAVEYLAGAGILELPSTRYQLAAFTLVNDWYDGTCAMGTATVGAQRLINQLKLSVDPTF